MRSIKTVLFALAAAMCLCTPAMAQKDATAAAGGKGKAAAKSVKAKKVSKASKKASGKEEAAEVKADTVSLADFSYYMGMAQTQSLKPYLAQRMNVDTTKMDDFMRGLNEALGKAEDKSLGAYAAGLQIGQQLMAQILPNINQRITDKAGEKFIDENLYKQGIVASLSKENMKVSPDSAMSAVQKQMEFYHNRLMEQKYGKNREEGEKFLAENAKKEGVKTLPGSTVQYKVLKEGTGEKPKETSKVKVNYEGKLIDGTVFDSSYKRNKPATFECNRVIQGWTQALTNMPVGSTWEIYIPQELGYGAQETGGKIPPYSTLIFKVELLSIEE